MIRRQVPEWLKTASEPVLFAHRGCSEKAPENTLTAFTLAKEYGIPGIELDVQMCASGELIVFHDFDFRRIGRLDKKTTELPWQEIRSIDAGRSIGGVYIEETIPLLSDVFEEFGTAFLYDIEIKHRERHTEKVEKKVVDLIQKFGLGRHCLVSSFNPFSIKQVRGLVPELPTALIYTKSLEVPVSLRRGAGRFFSSPVMLKPHWEQVNRWTMFWRHRLGNYQIIPWTVDSPDLARKLVSLGAAGIISNCPEELGI